MIKIAIIENESEIQRYGYSNIGRTLRRCVNKEKTEYTFVEYTSGNIYELFNESSPNSLHNFDAIFIATNAFGEDKTLNAFREKKEAIEKFVLSGKGIYISYQKKLNVETKYFNEGVDKATLDEVIRKKKIDFLPADFCFYFKEAFTFDEKKHANVVKPSDLGSVYFRNESNNFSITFFPNDLKQETILEHCLNNPFKKHIYKSHIIPDNGTSYTNVFYDNYGSEGAFSFSLLSISSNKRIKLVVSTIPFDEEGQLDVLENIISFISKGSPDIAYIYADDEDIRSSTISFLAESTNIDKTSYKTYTLKELKPKVFNWHQYYLFSSSISDEEIDHKWDLIRVKDKDVRFFHIQEAERDNFVFTYYSNGSFLNDINNRFYIWIMNLFSKKQGLLGGFWRTYDVLISLLVTNSTKKFDGEWLEKIYDDISNNHQKESQHYSYDGVFGTTLGLIQLYFLYFYDKPLFEKMKTVAIPWLEEVVKSDNCLTYDIVLYVNAFKELKRLLQIINNQTSRQNEDFITKIILNNEFKNAEQKALQFAREFKEEDINYLNEIETIRWLTFLKETKVADKLIKKVCESLFDHLILLQELNGKWHNTSRTAYIVNCLLVSFNKKDYDDYGLLEPMQRGIEFILQTYDSKFGAWAEEERVNENYSDELNMSTTATARCVQALYNYNNLSPLSSREILDNLIANNVYKKEVYDASYVFDTIKEINTKLHKAEQDYKASNKEVDALKEQIHQNEEDKKSFVEKSESNVRYQKKVNAIFRLFVFIDVILLVALVTQFFIILYDYDKLQKAGDATINILNYFAENIWGLLVTFLAQIVIFIATFFVYGKINNSYKKIMDDMKG